MSAAVQSIDAKAADTQDLTDGFHLIIDALKLNDLTTIYGVPGIPITDFGRMAQAAGIGVLSDFRHRAERRLRGLDRGFSDQEAGRLPHGVGAGFSQRLRRAGSCHHQLFSNDPDLGLVGSAK